MNIFWIWWTNFEFWWTFFQSDDHKRNFDEYFLNRWAFLHICRAFFEFDTKKCSRIWKEKKKKKRKQNREIEKNKRKRKKRAKEKMKRKINGIWAGPYERSACQGGTRLVARGRPMRHIGTRMDDNLAQHLVSTTKPRAKHCCSLWLMAYHMRSSSE